MSPDGRYTITGPAGTWRLFVGCAAPDVDFRYVQRNRDGETPESTSPTVTLIAATTITLDVTLQPAGRVEGVVVTSDGAPVEHAVVFVYAAKTLMASYGVGAVSDASGRFTSYVPYAVPTEAYAAAGGADALDRSAVFTVGPEQVVTGVRVVVRDAPTPSPADEGTSGAGGLPATGRTAAPIAIAGSLVLLAGIVVLATTRRRTEDH